MWCQERGEEEESVLGTGCTFLPAAKGGPEEGWDGKEEGLPPRPTSRLAASTLQSFSPSWSRGSRPATRGR